MAECVIKFPRKDSLPVSRLEESNQATRQAMDRFLAGIEGQAFRVAKIAVRNEADALDIVQDTMIRLVKSYSHRPVSEWRPLFYRILHNRTRDHQRHQTVRRRVLAWLSPRDHQDVPDAGSLAPGAQQLEPDRQVAMGDTLAALEQAVGELPRRQQQAFLLRRLEGLDVAETAAAMGCSAGSVKTHYSRAVHRLRDALGDHWE